MGTVWGVAAASTIIQNILASRLPGALSEIPDKEKVISLSLPPHSLASHSSPLFTRYVIPLRFTR